MQTKPTPAEGKNSAKLEAKSALRGAACCVSSSSVEEEEKCQREIEEWLETLRADKSLKSIWEYMAFLLDWKFREEGIGRAVYSEKGDLSSFTLYFGNIHIMLQAVGGVPNKAIVVGKYGILNHGGLKDRIDGKVGVMVKSHEFLLAARKKREATLKFRELVGMRSDDNGSEVLANNPAEHGAFADDCSPVIHSGGSSIFSHNVKVHTPLPAAASDEAEVRP